MAKALFENRFILTRKIHKQYCHETYKKMRTKTKILALSLAAISFVASLLILAFFKSRTVTIILMVASIYFVLTAFWGYTCSEWINFRSLKRSYAEIENGEVIYQLRFEPTQVHVKAGKTGFTFKYGTIEKVYETEDTFIFILSRKGMIEHGQIVFKNGFTDKSEGTLDEFKKYINEKSGNAIFDI